MTFEDRVAALSAEQQAALAGQLRRLARFSGITGAALADRPDLLIYMGIKPRGRARLRAL